MDLGHPHPDGTEVDTEVIVAILRAYGIDDSAMIKHWLTPQCIIKDDDYLVWFEFDDQHAELSIVIDAKWPALFNHVQKHIRNAWKTTIDKNVNENDLNTWKNYPYRHVVLLRDLTSEDCPPQFCWQKARSRAWKA